MPVDPPRDQQGKIIPHNHPDIRDEHFVIRHTTSHDVFDDQTTGRKRLASGAFSESTGGGMSVDVEEWLIAAGLDPLHYVTDPAHGAVRLCVGELRKLGFQVGWDPDDAHPYHGAVWGIGNGSKGKRKVAKLAVTLRKAAGED
jgi:hypothetical protein